MRNKKVISFISFIVIVIFLAIYCLAYRYAIRNNMELCMLHYKDYNYCQTLLESRK